MLAGVALGGRASLLGPALGAIAVGFGQSTLSEQFPTQWTYFQGALFIVVVLGTIARWAGFPLTRFLSYFKDEILITLGTCSTEAVMPRMMAKLERLGCEKSVVGLVLPTGYTFNADGTCIYLTMAAIFVAQQSVDKSRWL